MPTMLSNLQVDEVSLVDVPANEGARIELFKRDFSAAQRKEDAKSGKAMPDGSFPIHNEEDLHNAIRLAGHGKNPEAAKRHIRARAAAMGMSGAIPESWGKTKKSLHERILRKLGLWDEAPTLAENVSDAAAALSNSINEIMADEDLTKMAKQEAIQEAIDQHTEHLNGVIPEGIQDALKSIGLTTASVVNKGDDDMSEVADLKKQLDALKEELAVSKLSPAEREYYDSMTKAGKKPPFGKDDGDGDEDGKDDDGDGDGKDGKAKKFLKMSSAERRVAMDEAYRVPAHIQKQLAETEELRKRLASLESDREIATLQKRAEDIGMSKSDADLLQKAYRGDRTAVDTLLTKIGALNAQVTEAGLFREVGGQGRADGVGGSAHDQIMAAARELRKSNPKLTEAQAYAKVYAEDQDLRKSYRRQNNLEA